MTRSLATSILCTTLLTLNSAQQYLRTCDLSNNCVTTVNCIGEDACKASAVLCTPGEQCVINCIGKSSCADSPIWGDGATDIIIKCSGEDACKASSAFCGTGKCLLNCETAFGVCEGIGVNTNGALSFNCLNACPINILALIYTLDPTLSPTKAPTRIHPIGSPTTAKPTLNPTSTPSKAPSMSPSNHPSMPPTKTPTNMPSVTPSANPTANPSISPTFNPSMDPTMTPSDNPSVSPTKTPTNHPSINPTSNPSASPTKSPSSNPTIEPTSNPSINPTKPPTNLPTINPTSNPSAIPTQIPTNLPTMNPTSNPSVNPTMNPTTNPSTQPSINPTSNPSISPTINPTPNPTLIPTIYPSSNPTTYAPSSTNPTASPSSTPPTLYPSINPSVAPSINPSTPPSMNPSTEPTSIPSLNPSVTPTIEPTLFPSIIPTSNPSISPTFEPTSNPTTFPSVVPTSEPTSDPTYIPSISPTYNPSAFPSEIPSTDPTLEPTIEPTFHPTSEPTLEPTYNPSLEPTTTQPTLEPTFYPSQTPTIWVMPDIPNWPTPERPTISPSVDPTPLPTLHPTIIPGNMDCTVARDTNTINPAITNPSNIIKHGVAIDIVIDYELSTRQTSQIKQIITDILRSLIQNNIPSDQCRESQESIQINLYQNRINGTIFVCTLEQQQQLLGVLNTNNVICRMLNRAHSLYSITIPILNIQYQVSTIFIYQPTEPPQPSSFPTSTPTNPPVIILPNYHIINRSNSTLKPLDVMEATVPSTNYYGKHGSDMRFVLLTIIATLAITAAIIGCKICMLQCYKKRKDSEERKLSAGHGRVDFAFPIEDSQSQTQEFYHHAGKTRGIRASSIQLGALHESEALNSSSDEHLAEQGIPEGIDEMDDETEYIDAPTTDSDNDVLEAGDITPGGPVPHHHHHHHMHPGTHTHSRTSDVVSSRCQCSCHLSPMTNMDTVTVTTGVGDTLSDIMGHSDYTAVTGNVTQSGYQEVTNTGGPEQHERHCYIMQQAIWKAEAEEKERRLKVHHRTRSKRLDSDSYNPSSYGHVPNGVV